MISSVSVSAGDYSAELSALGAGVARLTLAGVDLLMAHDPSLAPEGYSGQTLLPWPNRLRDGAYQWQGRDYLLPCNDEGTHTALHGLVAESLWDIEEAGDSYVRFTLTVEASEAFPWTFRSKVTYHLDADSGLSITIATENLSSTPMPYGVSHHPYLMPGSGCVDDWTLEAPALSYFDADEQLIPVSKHSVDGSAFDFRTPVAMKSRVVDNCFSDLPATEWTVRVFHNVSGVSVCVHSYAPWLQMYSGDFIARAGLAVEPMTCPPNALATGEDLILIDPHSEHSFSYRISGSL